MDSYSITDLISEMTEKEEQFASVVKDKDQIIKFFEDQMNKIVEDFQDEAAANNNNEDEEVKDENLLDASGSGSESEAG